MSVISVSSFVVIVGSSVGSSVLFDVWLGSGWLLG